VPARINIIANFAALGGVIFLAYTMQVFLRVGLSDPVAFPMYTGSYAWIMMLFAAIAWNGMRLRGSQMSAELRADSLHYTVRLTIIGLWFAVMTLATSVFGVRTEIAQWLFLGLVIPLTINRIVARRRRRAVSSPSV
jgi:hypothetical protein